MIFPILLVAAMLTEGAASPCQPVVGEHILGRDLALAEPRLASLNSNLELGFSPDPGSKRVLGVAEVTRLARSVDRAPDESYRPVCFERATRLLTEQEILAAVQAWAPRGAQINVLERSDFPAPAGELTISRPSMSLTPHPGGAVLLHGYVSYGRAKRFPIWARVQFLIDRKVAVAAQDIAAGVEIQEDQIRLERRTGGLETIQFAEAVTDVVGRVNLRHLSAGDPLATSSLLPKKQVKPGAAVHVEVHNGATRLALTARAISGGRIGDLITVRNLSSGKAFQAKVTGEDAAVVIPARGFPVEAAQN